MEYLMAYGWAILIVAIVLGALFGLGFFNSVGLAPEVTAGSCQVYRPDGPGITTFISLEGTCNNELPQYVAKFASNGQISTASGANLPYFTLSAWVYPNTNNNGGIETSSGFGSHAIFVEGGGFKVRGGGVTTSAIGFTPKAWYFVVGEWGGSYLLLYINGKYATYQGGFAGPSGSSSAEYIGGGGSGYYFSGLISNVQLYNTSLSANEIAALYDEGIGGDPIDLNNLVGWWPLNGNANDYSGNLNNGIATSVVYTGAWTSGYSAP